MKTIGMLLIATLSAGSAGTAGAQDLEGDDDPGPTRSADREEPSANEEPESLEDARGENAADDSQEEASHEANANPERAAEPAEEESGEVDPQVSRQVAVAVLRALENRLTVWSNERSGRRVYVWHCRRARVDCRERLVAFAQLITEASLSNGIDPFLLAGIALRESGLNPFAEGGAGERGIVQLHPRGVGSRVRFVRNDEYRERCARRTDACQGEVLHQGAELIARSVNTCGTVREALGMYNTGVCQETSYSRRVLEERERLVGLSKENPRPAQQPSTMVD